MSYDLCLPEQAKNPYYIESIRTGIYSLEELCFFLYNNMYLIDEESIINEKLCDWIRDELHLKRLYRLLYEQLEKENGPVSFVLPIFREAGYLTGEEMAKYQEELSKLAVQPEEIRRKLRGDYLVKDRMYARASLEYQRILNRDPQKGLNTQFYASVWNNLGAAYAGLFQFSEAADCFLASYNLVKSRDTFRKYISALPMFLSEEEYAARLKELHADEELVRAIQEYNADLCRKPDFLSYREQMENRPVSELLPEFRDQYARSTRT